MEKKTSQIQFHTSSAPHLTHIYITKAKQKPHTQINLLNDLQIKAFHVGEFEQAREI